VLFLYLTTLRFEKDGFTYLSEERGVILLNRGAPLHRRITPILLRFSIKFPLSNVNRVVAIMFKQTPIGLLIWIFMRDNCPENGYNGTIARKAA